MPAGWASRCCRRISTTGEADFTVKDGKIVFGLPAIKGLGRGAAEEIVRAAAGGGPFRTSSISASASITRRAQGRHRTAHQGRRLRLPWRAIAAAADGRPCRAAIAVGQASAGRTASTASSTCSTPSTATAAIRRRAEDLPDVPEWPRTKSSSTRRKRSTSISPAIRWRSTRETADASRPAPGRARQSAANQEVVVGGMLTQVRFQNTKKRATATRRYARCKLEDFERLGRVRDVARRFRALQGRVRRGPHLLRQGRPSNGTARSRAWSSRTSSPSTRPNANPTRAHRPSAQARRAFGGDRRSARGNPTESRAAGARWKCSSWTASASTRICDWGRISHQPGDAGDGRAGSDARRRRGSVLRTGQRT